MNWLSIQRPYMCLLGTLALVVDKDRLLLLVVEGVELSEIDWLILK